MNTLCAELTTGQGAQTVCRPELDRCKEAELIWINSPSSAEQACRPHVLVRRTNGRLSTKYFPTGTHAFGVLFCASRCYSEQRLRVDYHIFHPVGKYAVSFR